MRVRLDTALPHCWRTNPATEMVSCDACGQDERMSYPEKHPDEPCPEQELVNIRWMERDANELRRAEKEARGRRATARTPFMQSVYEMTADAYRGAAGLAENWAAEDILKMRRRPSE